MKQCQLSKWHITSFVYSRKCLVLEMRAFCRGGTNLHCCDKYKSIVQPRTNRPLQQWPRQTQHLVRPVKKKKKKLYRLRYLFCFHDHPAIPNLLRRSGKKTKVPLIIIISIFSPDISARSWTQPSHIRLQYTLGRWNCDESEKWQLGCHTIKHLTSHGPKKQKWMYELYRLKCKANNLCKQVTLTNEWKQTKQQS